MSSILFSIKAMLGKKLTESFYKKMGKKFVAVINKYKGSIDIEWASIGNPRKQPIVFLHGFSDRKENFYFCLKRLKKDYYIILPDMPGFGQSTADENLVYDLDNYENWISEFIEGIGLKYFHLVGNSLGGAISAKLAMRHPERIKSLSLVDPAGLYISEEKSIYDEALRGINLFKVKTP